MSTMVQMTHAGVAGVATATLAAFEEVWEPAGWVLLEVSPVPYMPSDMRWTGPWDSGELYDLGDAVSRSGGTYVARLANRGHDPVGGAGATYWDLVTTGSAAVIDGGTP